jgi:hypothetical protein
VKVCHSDCALCSQPRSNTFDSEQLLSIVEEAVSADDDDRASDVCPTPPEPHALSPAQPLPRGVLHARGASGPVDLSPDTSVAASDCVNSADSTSSAAPQRQAAAAAQQLRAEAGCDAACAAGSASSSGCGGKPRRQLHMRSASGFGEALAFAQRPMPRAGAGSALSAEPPSAVDAATVRDSSSDGTSATPFEPWLAGLSPPTAETAAADGDASRWRLWTGEVSSLMVVVTPTRSDKSKAGIVPHAHLSDGRVHLVIVRKCTRFQFLRFLISLSRGGVDESLDYVEVKEVEAWRLEELGQALPQGSVWNVDGELMRTRHMSALCHHGLIEVFGRGPERV